MIGIAINKHKLHEIKMLMEAKSNKYVSYLGYPKSRIQFDIDEEKNITLYIPPMLTIELFRKEILPTKEDEPFTVHISGEKQGDYIVEDFRYPKSNTYGRDNIIIHMKKIKKRKNSN